jgi:hypothetical protein
MKGGGQHGVEGKDKTEREGGIRQRDRGCHGEK